MAQQEPSQHYNHGEPSSSGSPPQIVSSLSSSSSSSLPSAATSTTQLTPPKIFINARHYDMLLNNDDQGLQDEIGLDSDFSDLVSVPDNNTILHIAASGGMLYIINLIIQRCPRLLNLSNLKGDLPVHPAARACQLEAVKRLVSLANGPVQLSTMLEKESEDKNTVIHIALLSHQEEMAKFLFEKCLKTFYYLNKQGFSPLYLAIKAGFWDLAKEMLSEDIAVDNSDAEGKLRAGESVVHAAIIAKKKDIFEKILDVYNDLQYKTDELKRTPLSFAAYTGFLEGVKYMFNRKQCRNQAFKKDENGCFPIHWACTGGNIKIVKEFFLNLPNHTRFFLNNKGQNILHVAAANGKAEVVKYILLQPELETLINMKDEDGNTPFHLASKGKHPKVVYALTWDDRVKLTLQNNQGLTALDIAEEYYVDIPSFEERLTWLSLRYAGVPRAPQLRYFNILGINDPRNTNNPDTFVQNSSTSPAASIILEQLLDQLRDPQKTHHRMKRKHKYKERINSLLVVSILVTTVTYASGFTVPGGYNNNAPNEGMATLVHKHAFQVFVISNTIAMYTSILAAVTLIWAHVDDLGLVMLSLEFALPLLGIALVMMSVAFMAGLYVVLYNVVSWLSIVVLRVCMTQSINSFSGGLFLGSLMVLFIPLYSPTSCIRNTILRYVFHVPFMIMLLACEKGKSGTHYC